MQWWASQEEEAALIVFRGKDQIEEEEKNWVDRHSNRPSAIIIDYYIILDRRKYDVDGKIET